MVAQNLLVQGAGTALGAGLEHFARFENSVIHLGVISGSGSIASVVKPGGGTDQMEEQEEDSIDNESPGDTVKEGHDESEEDVGDGEDNDEDAQAFMSNLPASGTARRLCDSNERLEDDKNLGY